MLVIVGLIIAGSCYGHLLSTYKKYSQVPAQIGCNALNLVSACLDHYNLDTKIALIDGEFTDAYSGKKDIILLTKTTAYGKSVADISIASHEFGHALQKNEKSTIYVVDMLFRTISKIANFFLPITLLCTLVFLFFEGLKAYSLTMVYVSAGLWLVTFLLKILTIPLELDASKKAYNVLKENKIFTKEELKQTKKMLNAAALTYVGALFIGLYKIIKKIQNSFRRD